MLHTPNNAIRICFCFSISGSRRRRRSIGFSNNILLTAHPPFPLTYIHLLLSFFSFLSLLLMAAASGRKSFLFFGGAGRVNPRNVITSSDDAEFELEESDVWIDNSHDAQPTRKSLITGAPGRGMKKPTRKPVSGISDKTSSVATSLPVKIPDWSRILGEEYKGHHKRESEEGVEDEDDGEDDEDGCGRLPPHEYLARTRGSSFSVHEGIGRTLKGRDLSRVRNAVWKQTGFED